MTTHRIDVAAAVNRVDVLEACLRRSPDLTGTSLTLRVYQGFASAGAAYNAALMESDADILVLVHQDVYLPRGFLKRLSKQLDALDAAHPDWAVAGVIGLDEEGRLKGRTWSSGLGKIIGTAVGAPERVVTLDEVMLVVRRASDITFDADLPSFHLYGADCVLSARAMGKGAYVIDVPIVHHSRPVLGLDGGYKRAYRYMQRKWRAVLPVPNLVCPLRRSILPMLMWDLKTRWMHRGRRSRSEPSGRPDEIARRLGFEA